MQLQTVSRYNMQGWVEDLPQLIEERYAHGCGSYLRDDGTQVSVDSVGYLCVCRYYWSNLSNNLKNLFKFSNLTKDFQTLFQGCTSNYLSNIFF